MTKHDDAKRPRKIAGNGMLLRELTVEDVSPDYLAWLNDREINRYLETRFSEQTMETIADFVREKYAGESEHLFGIFVEDGRRHIGNIKVGPVNGHHKRADVSLFIGDKSFWGRGLATEAIALATRFGFETLGLEKLCAGCYEQNIGSKRAFEKNGYQVEGFFHGHVISEGARRGEYRLGLLNPALSPDKEKEDKQ